MGCRWSDCCRVNWTGCFSSEADCWHFGVFCSPGICMEVAGYLCVAIVGARCKVDAIGTGVEIFQITAEYMWLPLTEQCSKFCKSSKVGGTVRAFFAPFDRPGLVVVGQNCCFLYLRELSLRQECKKLASSRCGCGYVWREFFSRWQFRKLLSLSIARTRRRSISYCLVSSHRA